MGALREETIERALRTRNRQLAMSVILQLVLRAMAATNVPRRRRSALVLRDVQFWIPVVVLIAGLLVLGWIH